jgi:hypothetical protein
LLWEEEVGCEMLALTAASRTAARQRGPAWRRRELHVWMKE